MGCLDPVPALEVLLSNTTDLLVFASLSSCSKDFRQRCSTVVSQNIQTLLPIVITDALRRGLSRSARLRSTDALSWLCKTAGSALVDEWVHCAQAILSISNVPQAVASILVEAGVRVSLEQLHAACLKKVAGVEVWVTACTELGYDTGLPAAVEAICCHDIQALQKALEVEHNSSLPSEEVIHIYDLLDIACNMNAAAPAHNLVASLQCVTKILELVRALLPALRTALGFGR